MNPCELKIEQGISVVEDDANFHLAISEATHNKIQTHLMFSIYDILKESLGQYLESIRMSDIYDQHCKVVEAVKKKDPDLAAVRMREHLDYVKSRVKELASQDIELYGDYSQGETTIYAKCRKK